MERSAPNVCWTNSIVVLAVKLVVVTQAQKTQLRGWAVDSEAHRKMKTLLI